jgi:hypothetical protein
MKAGGIDTSSVERGGIDAGSVEACRAALKQVALR